MIGIQEHMGFMSRLVSWGVGGALLFSLAFGAFQPRAAFAAAGEGTATIAIGTGGTSASDATYGSAGASGSVTVGTLSYGRIALTVGASGIAAAQNNVTLQINSNLFPATSWVTAKEGALTSLNALGEWFVSYTDNGGATNNAAISFAASSAVNTGLITIQADQQMDSGDVITITFGVQDISYARAAANMVLQVDDTGGNSLSTIATPPTIATVAADAGGSVVVATPTVGGSGTVTVTLTSPFAIDANDTIDITFPDYMNVSGMASHTAGGTFDGDGATTLTCDDAAQVVTCTASGVTAATGTIILTGVTSYYVGTSNITSLEIEDEGVAANDIATDTTVALTDITAADAAASVTLGLNSEVSYPGTTTLTFTLPVTLDAGDTLEITFPSSLNISSAAYSSQTFTGTPVFSSCAVAGQVLTCTAVGASTISAGTGSVLFTGIIAIWESSTDITVFEVEDEGVAANDITTDSVVAMTNTTGGGSGGSSSDTDTEVERTYGVSLTSPAEDAELTPGSYANILWETTGDTLSGITLAYSLDNGSSYTTIVTNTSNDGSYTWLVPDVASENVTLRIQGTDLVDVLASDTSDTFTILGSSEDGTDTSDTTDSEDTSSSDSSESGSYEAGSYLKAESWETVYYIDADGTRRPFLDAQTFFTYEDDFSGIIEVSDEEIARYTMGSPMLAQAGVSLVKIESVAKVYAVEMVDGVQTLRWITSEEVANSLFGAQWADYVIDVPVTAWARFSVGEDVSDTADIEVDTDIMKTRSELASS